MIAIIRAANLWVRESPRKAMAKKGLSTTRMRVTLVGSFIAPFNEPFGICFIKWTVLYCHKTFIASSADRREDSFKESQYFGNSFGIFEVSFVER